MKEGHRGTSRTECGGKMLPLGAYDRLSPSGGTGGGPPSEGGWEVPLPVNESQRQRRIRLLTQWEVEVLRPIDSANAHGFSDVAEDELVV